MTLKEAEQRIAALEAQVQMLASQVAMQRTQPVVIQTPEPSPPWTHPYTISTVTTTAPITTTWSGGEEEPPPLAAVPA